MRLLFDTNALLWLLGGDDRLGAAARGAVQSADALVVSVAAGIGLRDTQTGFRWYSRRLLEQIGIPGSRFEAESAVLVLAARRGMRVVSTPVQLGYADGVCTSHFRSVVDSWRIARAVYSARYGALSRQVGQRT